MDEDLQIFYELDADKEENDLDAYANWANFFALRMLQQRGRSLGSHWWLLHDEEMMELLQMSEKAYTRATVSARLKRVRHLVSKQAPERHGSLFQNVDRFAERLGLNRVESRLMLLVTMTQMHKVLESLLENTETWSMERLSQYLAAVIQEDADLVHKALRPGEILRSAGILTETWKDGGLEIMPGLAGLLMREHSNAETLFAPLFTAKSSVGRDLTDFPHLAEHGEFLVDLLRGAQQQVATGINLFFHGAPGTGKTEFAHAVAKALGWSLTAVRTSDQDDDPIDGDQRFSAYALCQRALSRQQDTLVLFDGVEDVFSEPSPWDRRAARHKGWTNRLLESNVIPTIWISNQIHGLDTAYRRRFTYEMEFSTPPAAVRETMLAQHLQGLPVDPEWTRNISAKNHFTPGQMHRAGRVAHLLAPQSREMAESIVKRMLGNGSDEALSLSTSHYDIQLIEAQPSPQGILDSLRHQTDGRLLFSGPPGTGKTAFTQHLADALARSLYRKTASDLLGKYVGETEQRLAAAFQEARGEILFIDEADSFLQNRDVADHAWEVSQVNELLQQMEAFQGVLVMATNRKGSLDPAVFRRFDIEVRFDYLRKERRERLWRAIIDALHLSPQGAEANQAHQWVLSCSTLTPADLQGLLRRNRFSTLQNIGAVMDALEIMQSGRCNTQQSSIGFTAHNRP